ncbi:MAG: hypothetical protein K9H49_07290 [Bacteroidales bacterium]|nr:hypothetical protein [Bacteroidales bacterium]MCF8390316.1 hypothetical protein [Bacteroidales bacterium]
MKKDKLEAFIKENRGDFDFHKPEEEVFSKVILRKPSGLNRSRKILKNIYRIAAVLLIFVASYAFHEFVDIKKAKIANARNSDYYNLKPEIKEAEFYYNNQVTIKLNELQPFLVKFPELNEEVQMDFSELDSIYLSLKEDLKENIDNEQVLEAMIQNYRLKIKILEDLLSDISPNKTQDEDEKYNI